MYPTDEIYGQIFNFTSKPTAIEHFEILGYDGSNFVTMTGSVLINILIPIITYLMNSVILKLTYKFKRYKCSRQIGCMVS